jgi:hypothetical protein
MKTIYIILLVLIILFVYNYINHKTPKFDPKIMHPGSI